MPLGYKPNIISTVVDHIMPMNSPTGYKPNIISTVVDTRRYSAGYFGGYKPNIISTVVDSGDGNFFFSGAISLT